VALRRNQLKPVPCFWLIRTHMWMQNLNFNICFLYSRGELKLRGRDINSHASLSRGISSLWAEAVQQRLFQLIGNLS
jgi:hypothetical protein